MKKAQIILGSLFCSLSLLGCSSTPDLRVEVPYEASTAHEYAGHKARRSYRGVRVRYGQPPKGFYFDELGDLHAKPQSQFVVLGKIRVESKYYPDLDWSDSEDSADYKKHLIRRLKRKAFHMGATHVVGAQVLLDGPYEELPRVNGYAVRLKNAPQKSLARR